MAKDGFGPRSGSVEGSNVPGNPLRSYRMSMLAHGFVDSNVAEEFVLDESDPGTYSVVRLRGKPLTLAAYASIAIVLLAFAAFVYLFG